LLNDSLATVSRQFVFHREMADPSKGRHLSRASRDQPSDGKLEVERVAVKTTAVNIVECVAD
jgi:hypothetical protein